MNQSFSFVSFGLLFLLASCAVVPEMAPLPQPKDPSSYETKESFVAEKSKWSDEKWWQTYGDPQLNGLIEEALIQSPDIAEAEARLRKAGAFEEQADSNQDPQVSFNGSYNKLKQSYNNGLPPALVPHKFQDSTNSTLNFNYGLDFWGLKRSLFEAAVSQKEASALETVQVRLIVATSIADAYAELMRLYQNYDEACESSKARTKTAELFLKRFKEGLENEGSYEQASSLKAMSESEVEGLSEQIDLLKNKIAALMGAGPDRGRMITKPARVRLHTVGLPTNIPAELIGRRADIAASRMMIQVQKKNIDAAEASFYPNINLAAYGGYQSLGLDFFARTTSTIAAIGPAISLPLFNTGALKGAYREKRADYDAAVAKYNGAVVKALNDVADVLVSQKKLNARTKNIEAAVKASKRAYDLVYQRYKGGLTTYLEVLRAEDTFITSKRALADIQARGFSLDIALIRALGGGFIQHSQKGGTK